MGYTIECSYVYKVGLPNGETYTNGLKLVSFWTYIYILLWIVTLDMQSMCSPSITYELSVWNVEFLSIDWIVFLAWQSTWCMFESLPFVILLLKVKIKQIEKMVRDLFL